MRPKLISIPDWASPSLQGLTYWLGSQHALGLAANISEGAIAWELSRLLFTHREGERFLEAEVQYRHIPEFVANNALDNSRERADLVIARRRRTDRSESYAAGEIEAVIEIKHSRSQKALVWADIDFLAERREASSAVRTFFIYASVNERPEEFTDREGRAAKPRDRSSPSGNARFRIRRVCRATSRIPAENKNAKGHYAVLIEVDPTNLRADG